jgi:hypothetical protein
MTGANPMSNWRFAMDTVIAMCKSHPSQVIPITMDFNHRKPLGPLEKLWNLTKEYAPYLQILVLSIDSLLEISQLEKLKSSFSGK